MKLCWQFGIEMTQKKLGRPKKKWVICNASRWEDRSKVQSNGYASSYYTHFTCAIPADVLVWCFPLNLHERLELNVVCLKKQRLWVVGHKQYRSVIMAKGPHMHVKHHFLFHTRTTQLRADVSLRSHLNFGLTWYGFSLSFWWCMHCHHCIAARPGSQNSRHCHRKHKGK